MLSAAPFLTVIVPAYNEERIITSTLTSMRTYLSRQAYSYEIIVSADGTDGTRDLVAKMARHDARLSVIGSVRTAAARDGAHPQRG